MKRILSSLLVFALVLTMLVPAFAFAADKPTAEEMAKALNGIFQGDENGNLNLDKPMQRSQLAKIISLLMKLEVKAPAADAKSTFGDVAGNWAYNEGFIDAVVKAEYMKGTNTAGTAFNPTGNVSYAELATVVARLLKVDVKDSTPWFKGNLEAVQKAGFLTDITVETANGAAPTSALVEGAYVANQALNQPPVVAAKIASATALTNTMVSVTLSEATTAVDAAVFSVEGLTLSNATLSSDGKVVTLTTSAQTPGTLYVVKANDTSAEFVGQVVDTTKPALTSALALSNQAVKVTFDNTDLAATSALNPANYVINDLTVSAAVWGDTHGEVILTTNAQTSGKLYEVKVSNVADLSGNVIAANSSKKFGGKAADTTKPVVSGLPVAKDGFKVEVTFVEAELLDAVSALDVANYTINNGLTVTAAEFKEDTNVFGGNPVVILTTSEQKLGTLYTLTVKNVKDAAGNIVADTSKNFGGSPKDTSKLNLNSAVADTNTSVTLTFDDNVDTATGANVANYTINDLTVTAAEVDGATVVLTTSVQTSGKLYTVTVANVLDDAGNALNTAERKFGGKAADAVKPTISSVNATDSYTVVVVFDEKVTKVSATKLSNFVIEGLGYPTKATLAGDGKTLTLKTAKQSSTLYTLKVSNVSDLSGNIITAASEKKFAGIGDALGKVTVDSAYAVDKHTFKLTFNQAVNKTQAETEGNYTVTSSTNSGSNIGTTTGAVISTTDVNVKATLSSDGKEVTITFASGFSMVGSEVYTVAVAGVTGKYGAALDTNADEYQFAGVTNDKTKATVDMINVIDNSTIEIVFSQDVTGVAKVTSFALYTDENNIPSAANTGATLTGTGVAGVSGNKVTLNLNGTLANNTVYYLNVLADNDLSDVSTLYVDGNYVSVDDNAKKFEGIFATGVIPAAKLTVDGAVMVDVNTVDVYFSKDLNDNGFDMTGDVEIKKGNTTVVDAIDDVKAYAIDGSKLTLYFVASGTITSGDVLSVVFADNDHLQYVNQTAVDLGDSDAAEQAADFAAVDTANTAPYLVSAQAVANDTFKLSLSESLVGFSKADLKIKNTKTGIELAQADFDLVGYADGATSVIVKLNNGGLFISGTSYDVAVVNGSAVTDYAGIQTIKKAAASDYANGVSFTGVGSVTALTLVDAQLTLTFGTAAANDEFAASATAGFAASKAYYVQLVGTTAATVTIDRFVSQANTSITSAQFGGASVAGVNTETLKVKVYDAAGNLLATSGDLDVQ